MNVTYLLGAGASANTLPVVAGMNERLARFNQFLFEDFNDMPVAFNSGWHILEKIQLHASVDTYAKKLFLQHSVDWTSEIELLQLKYYLSLFFVAEQSSFYEKYSPFYSEEEHKHKDDRSRFYPNKLVDARYDAFLASLLEQEDKALVLPQNINIISWNYDIQMELAYMSFAKCGLDDAFKSLNVIPPKAKSELGSKVIKLNGTAGMITSDYTDVAFNFWGNDYRKFSQADFRKLIEEYIKIDLLADKRNLTKPVLNFAWEKDINKFSKATFDAACEVMELTNILVVIGYTFPNFNRKVDRSLLDKTLKNLKKVYYQSRSEEIESLVVRLKGILPHYSSNKFHPEIIPYSDTKQFCIPYEL